MQATWAKLPEWRPCPLRSLLRRGASVMCRPVCDPISSASPAQKPPSWRGRSRRVVRLAFWSRSGRRSKSNPIGSRHAARSLLPAPRPRRVTPHAHRLERRRNLGGRDLDALLLQYGDHVPRSDFLAERLRRRANRLGFLAISSIAVLRDDTGAVVLALRPFFAEVRPYFILLARLRLISTPSFFSPSTISFKPAEGCSPRTVSSTRSCSRLVQVSLP